AIVHGRLVRRERELVGLTGELTAMIVLPYLGAAAARREQQRPAPVSRTVGEQPSQDAARVDPLGGVGMRFTYRTVRILEGALEHPGASNRELAEFAGIQDQGQVSKLLARLQHRELLAKDCVGHGKGEPNAWSLTAKGEQVVQGLRLQKGLAGRAS